VTDEFKALAGDRFTQGIMFRAATATLPKSAGAAAQQAAQRDLGERIAALQVDSPAAAEMKVLLALPAVRDTFSAPT